MMNGTVIQVATHPIVVDVRAVDSDALMVVLLPPHPVFSEEWCDMLAAGVGHMWQVKRGQTYWYHVLTDKIVDVVLLFFWYVIFILWLLKGLVVLLNWF